MKGRLIIAVHVAVWILLFVCGYLTAAIRAGQTVAFYHDLAVDVLDVADAVIDELKACRARTSF